MDQYNRKSIWAAFLTLAFAFLPSHAFAAVPSWLSQFAIQDCSSSLTNPSGYYIVPQNQVPREVINQAAGQAINLAQELYEQSEAIGGESIFPIHPALYSQIYYADQKTGLSFLAFDGDGNVVGFALAYQTPEGGVELEKYGISPHHQGAGIARRLMGALAQSAARIKAPYIQLLVRKGNEKAKGVYEHYGFQNMVPEEDRSDPRANAYLYAVDTQTLVQNTTAR